MKQTSPAAERNKQAILKVLTPLLSQGDIVLEIASGTGQHGAFFTQKIPNLKWQPTDLRSEAIKSIASYRKESHQDRFLEPRLLDVNKPSETHDSLVRPQYYNSVFCANMIHISPFQSCLALLELAARVVKPNGTLILYGPFKQKDRELEASNQQFHESLVKRDPSWGIRELEKVKAEATAKGFHHLETHQMPANNLTVVFQNSKQPQISTQDKAPLRKKAYYVFLLAFILRP